MHVPVFVPTKPETEPDSDPIPSWQPDEPEFTPDRQPAPNPFEKPEWAVPGEETIPKALHGIGHSC